MPQWLTQAAIASVLPALIALAGIFYTQHQAQKREKELWMREKLAGVCGDFLGECQRLWRWAAMHTRVGYKGQEGEYDTPMPDWIKEAYRLKGLIDIYGSKELSDAAQELLNAIDACWEGTTGAFIRCGQAEESFKKASRKFLWSPKRLR